MPKLVLACMHGFCRYMWCMYVCGVFLHACMYICMHAVLGYMHSRESARVCKCLRSLCSTFCMHVTQVCV